MKFSQNERYIVTTSILSTGYNISVNGTQIAFISSDPFQAYLNLSMGTGVTTERIWGFGPLLHQAAYFKESRWLHKMG